MINVDISRIFDENLRRTRQKPVAFNSGNPETTVISRAHPIDRLVCRLTGTLNNSATGTIRFGGAMNLIKRVSLIMDGKDVLFSLPGQLVQYVSDLYTLREAAKTEPAGGSTGNQPFTYYFEVPINMGPDTFTLLDAASRNDLILEVLWGAAADIFTTGGGTLTLSGVQLDVFTVANAGGVVGQPGGINFGYPYHLIDYREITIEQAQTEKIVDLLQRHLYSRVAFLTLGGASAAALAPVDTILNGVKVSIDQSVIQTATGALLKDENACRYNFAPRTGFYVFDFMNDIAGRSGRITHMLGVNSTLPFYLTLDVAHPNTVDRILMVSDRIARPDISQSVR